MKPQTRGNAGLYVLGVVIVVILAAILLLTLGTDTEQSDEWQPVTDFVSAQDAEVAVEEAGRNAQLWEVSVVEREAAIKNFAEAGRLYEQIKQHTGNFETCEEKSALDLIEQNLTERCLVQVRDFKAIVDSYLQTVEAIPERDSLAGQWLSSEYDYQRVYNALKNDRNTAIVIKLQQYLGLYGQHLSLVGDPILRKSISSMSPQEQQQLQSHVEKLGASFDAIKEIRSTIPALSP